MAKCFSQSHDAYNRGDHGGAKQFSTQGKQHQKRMDELNKEASDWIFRGLLYSVFYVISFLIVPLGRGLFFILLFIYGRLTSHYSLFDSWYLVHSTKGR